MAKRKKKAKKKDKLTSQQYKEIKQVRENLDPIIVSKAECVFCGEIDEDEQTSFATTATRLAISHAKNLYKTGWREVNSDNYQLIGLACPVCAKLPDEER